MKTFVALFLVCIALGCSSVKPPPPGQIAIALRGEVNHPGSHIVPEGVSLSKALELSGGVTDLAYLKRMRITHRDGSVEQCQFRKEGTHFSLADGDQVYVSNNGF